MADMIQILDDNLRVVVVLTLGIIFILGTITKVIVSIYTTSCREKSRREIAAYVAEGSITPDQGERLIKANVNNPKQFNF